MQKHQEKENTTLNISANSDIIRKKAEELLKKRKSKLKSLPSESQVLRLIHELEVHQIELELQNEELLKINSEKDKFFSIIAHDLRSPFNSFLGLTQIMADELPLLSTTQAQELASGLQNSATNLFRLLENLLHWASLQQGLVNFSPAYHKLLPLVNESIEIIIDQAKAKAIDITYNIPDSLEILADRNMLETVIRNLVSNAVKFTKKGGKIVISASVINDKNIEVSVSDNGIGMNQSLLDDLFLLKKKSNREGTNGELSTGLGLIICKDLIEKLGGKLNIESEEGKGTNFKFVVPSFVEDKIPYFTPFNL